MTIAQKIGNLNAAVERIERRDEFFTAVRCLMLAKLERTNPANLAREQRAPERVVDFITKAVTSPMTTADGAAIAPHSLASAFISSLVGQSIFDSIAPFSVAVSPRTSAVAISTGFSSSAIPESSLKPLSKLTITGSDIDPAKTAGQCVVTAELLKFGGPLAERVLRSHLTSAVVRGTDVTFLGLLGAVTSFATSGSTPVAAKQDISTLLQNTSTGANSVLFLATTPAIAKAWAALPEGGAATFADATYKGGEIAGIPVVVSDAIPAGEIWLIDATAIATATDGGVLLDATAQALVQMDTTPDSPPSASTAPQSLWQTNGVAVRAERFIGAKLMRANGACRITGVNYSGGSP